MLNIGISLPLSIAIASLFNYSSHMPPTLTVNGAKPVNRPRHQKRVVYMNKKLKSAFESEMTSARKHYLLANYDQCFKHLERAHILGQRNYIPHVINHFWMMKVALKISDWREAMGQFTRMVMSVGSLIGMVPIGNSGRARISPIKPMPIPSDLQKYFNP